MLIAGLIDAVPRRSMLQTTTISIA
jgi:hypothetical protein